MPTVTILGEPVRGTSLLIENGISSTFFAANVGTGAGVFQSIISGTAYFKSIINGTGILLTNNTNDLTLAVDTSYITSLVNIGPVGYTLNRVIVSNITNGALVVSATTKDEVELLSGLTGGVLQTQLANKQPLITGGATTITSANLTFSRALVSDASGKVIVSVTTLAELAFISGVTSPVQTQLNTLSAAIGVTITNPLSSDLAIPTAYKLNFNSGALLINSSGFTGAGGVSITLSSGIVSAGGGFNTGSTTYKCFTISIGDWNMDANTAAAVPHGLANYKKYRGCMIVIRDDADSVYSDSFTTDTTGVTNVGTNGLDSTYIGLVRRTGGTYDSTSYDSTGYNRGFITIFYEP